MQWSACIYKAGPSTQAKLTPCVFEQYLVPRDVHYTNVKGEELTVIVKLTSCSIQLILLKGKKKEKAYPLWLLNVPLCVNTLYVLMCWTIFSLNMFFFVNFFVLLFVLFFVCLQ